MSTLKILIIDDDEEDYLITARYLQQSQTYTYEVAWLADYQAGLAALVSNHYDLAFIDFRLGKDDGIELLRESISKGCNIPLITFTGESQSDTDQCALEAGALDFLEKGAFDAQILDRAIRYAISRKNTENELKAMSAKNKRLAEYDVLTGLANRRRFERLFPQILARDERNRLHVALFFLDLNDFKQINDNFGHDIGDELLRQTAQRLRKTLRRTDYIFRIAGDEFTVIIEGDLNVKKIVRVAEKISKAFQQPFILEDHQVHVGVSIGIATSFRCGMDAETLIKCADSAMYAAKSSPKQRFHFFSEDLNTETTLSFSNKTFIDSVLRNNRFCVLYEPEYSLADRKIIGASVQAYVLDKDKQKIPMPQLLSMAEDSGLLAEFIFCLFDKAWQECADSMRKGSWYLSLRVPDVLWQQTNLSQWLVNLSQTYAIAPGQIQLALGQDVLMLDPAASIARIKELHAQAIRVLLDDFGLGNLAMRWLPLYPVIGFKVALELVRDIEKDPNHRAIIMSVLDLGKHLQQPVYVPALTNADLLAFAQNYGAFAGQGAFLHDPVLASHWLALLAD